MITSAQFELQKNGTPVFVEAEISIHSIPGGFIHAFGFQPDREDSVELVDYIATTEAGEAVTGLRKQVAGWVEENRNAILERI